MQQQSGPTDDLDIQRDAAVLAHRGVRGCVRCGTPGPSQRSQVTIADPDVQLRHLRGSLAPDELFHTIPDRVQLLSQEEGVEPQWNGHSHLERSSSVLGVTERSGAHDQPATAGTPHEYRPLE